jgi:8-oxo-dGTP pyrophosphatase MutT (NUDIX family)
MKFETRVEFDGKIQAVSVLLRNRDGYLLLQKRTANAPTSPGKISGFGGMLEEDETAYQALKRELLEELELDINKIDSKPTAFDYVESKSNSDSYIAMIYIDNVDDSKLVLHEGESIVKVKYLSEIKQEDMSGSLLNIKDDTLPR